VGEEPVGYIKEASLEPEIRPEKKRRF